MVDERVVDSGGVPLHVVDHGAAGAGGTGTAVVLLHGGGRAGGDWDDVAARLGALGHRPVTVDLRGHGATPTAPWAWDLALGDVAAVVDALALDRPAVVGHSLGGMIAALWAAEHPECPLAVNLDGHGNPTRADQYAGLDTAGDEASDPQAAAQAGVRAHRAMQAAYAPMAAGLDDHLRAVMRRVDELDLYAVYRAARCPLLIVSGQQSMAELLPDDAQEPWRAYERWVQQQLAAAAAANPAVELVSLPTGHDAHLEAPEAVASLIDDRLRPDPQARVR